MRHYDVQMIGGAILHQGMIAEMTTGEGKTLVSSGPAFLNALVGHVHVITVNDYLAKRDMEWIGPIHTALGLTVGAIQSNMPAPRAQSRLRLRHHLRDQQRVRLRLPAGQYEAPRGTSGPGPAGLRHRRRDRQYPDRRGPHPADHQRPGPRRRLPLPRRRPHRPAAKGRRPTSRSRRRNAPATSPNPASAGPRNWPASSRSIRPATWSGRTLSTTPSRPITCTSATTNTWSAAGR